MKPLTLPASSPTAWPAKKGIQRRIPELASIPVGPTTVIISKAPPSTNNLFAGSGKRRFISQKYGEWRKLAADEIALQRPSRIPGRVILDIAVRRPRSNADVSNYIKAAEDALVTAKVIDDDKFVEIVTVRWAVVTGCQITITQVRDPATHALPHNPTPDLSNGCMGVES